MIFLSWIDIGRNEKEVEFLKEIGLILWKVKKLTKSNDPFRPWMSINFVEKLCGCRWCSRLLCVDPSDIGTKRYVSGAFGTFGNLIDYINFERNVFLLNCF